ncbi:MAG: hypothetical protein ACYS47_09295 [Planctomycetota bacterium]|jgi:hypothetical protein
MTQLDFLSACRARGEVDGEYWAENYSKKRLEIELASPSPGMLALTIHAEITARRLADEMQGDPEAGEKAFVEGFREGIRKQLEG